MKPIWKVLVVVVVIVAAVAVLFFIPHHRAKEAVNAYREQLKQRGEKMTIAELTPGSPADEVKAGRDFLVAAGGVGQFDDWPMMKPLAPGRALVSWSEPVSVTGDSSNCWADMSPIAKEHREAGEVLNASLQGPAMSFTVNYAAGYRAPLTHIVDLREAGLWLSGAALLAMHDRDTNAAWRNLRAEANLVRMNHGEPLLVSQLVRVRIVQIAVATLWEALQFHGWSDPQLAELQTNWASFNLLDHVESSPAMERVHSGPAFEELRTSFSKFSDAVNLSSAPKSGGPIDSLFNPADAIQARLRYRAWRSWISYEEELVALQVLQAATESARRIRQSGASVPELNHFQAAVTNILKDYPGWEKRFILTGNNLRGYGNSGMGGIMLRFLSKTAVAENERRMAVAAIALERFRLRHGEYPAQLQDLVPEYLREPPIDLMDGKPLRYRRKDDGTFLLYSVGEDGKDDGGDPTPLSSPSAERGWLSSQWDETRDTVWPLPATADEVKKYEAEMRQEYSQRWPHGKPEPPKPVPAPAGGGSKTN